MSLAHPTNSWSTASLNFTQPIDRLCGSIKVFMHYFSLREFWKLPDRIVFYWKSDRKLMHRRNVQLRFVLHYDQYLGWLIEVWSMCLTVYVDWLGLVRCFIFFSFFLHFLWVLFIISCHFIYLSWLLVKLFFFWKHKRYIRAQVQGEELHQAKLASTDICNIQRKSSRRCC